MSGREFDLVTYQVTWGHPRVYFHDNQGQLVSVPAGWTDVFPPDPFVRLAAGRSAFRLVDLVELAKLLKRRRPGDAR